MPQMPSRWLLRLAALTGMMISGQVALAATSDAPVEVSSFSGAYLAARVAEVDNDLDGAIAYYKKALAFDPENQALQQSVMLALISQGRFDELLPYAEKLKTVARGRAVLAPCTRRRCLPQEGLQGGGELAQSGARIRSRRSGLQGSDGLGEVRRRRQCRGHGDA